MAFRRTNQLRCFSKHKRKPLICERFITFQEVTNKNEEPTLYRRALSWQIFVILGDDTNSTINLDSSFLDMTGRVSPGLDAMSNSQEMLEMGSRGSNCE